MNEKRKKKRRKRKEENSENWEIPPHRVGHKENDSEKVYMVEEKEKRSCNRNGHTREMVLDIETRQFVEMKKDEDRKGKTTEQYVRGGIGWGFGMHYYDRGQMDVWMDGWTNGQSGV